MGKKIRKWVVMLMALLISTVLMAYPFISNYVFEHRKESVLSTYEEKVDSAGKQELQAMLEAAKEYNKAVFSGHVQLHDPFSEEVIGASQADYLSQLSVDGSDIMGYIDVPCIGVSLPIYHGTSAETLEKGVGHLEGTSLPVGGESTHCVLTGHTGLNSSKMFTDLTELEEGDLFILRVLDEDLAYKVDQVKVVEPDELSDLTIEEGKDYCTLVTCTPYGVNTHRLLVRGVRTEYVEDDVETASTTEAALKGSQWMSEYKKALAAAAVAITAACILIIAYRQRKEGNTGKSRKIRKLLGVLLILVGILIYLYPTIQEWRVGQRTESVIQEFSEKYGTGDDGTPSGGEVGNGTGTGQDAEGTLGDGESSTEAGSLDALLAEMQEYNRELAEDGQSVADAWNYEQAPVDLTALSTMDGAFGYIEIPDMDLTLPLYIGASEENMALGAAVMSGTSMPVGGTDTNSVIVGHRGYSGAPYFRDIEDLKEGSMVYVTNPWGRMAYKVTSIAIIDPHETDPILIQPGKDMITLLTCHPYMSHGKKRYLVYCERTEDDGKNISGSDASGVLVDFIRDFSFWEPSDGNSVEGSSQALVRVEKFARTIMPAVLLIIIIPVFFRKENESGRKRHETG